MSDTYHGGTYHSETDHENDDSAASDATMPGQVSSEPAGETSASFGLVSSSSAPDPNQVSSAWQESTNDAAAQALAAAEVAPAVVTPTVHLSAIEARVLGSLIEKSFLTPDTYPMTTNAMVTACNQKTNRDPVVAYSAVQVDSVLLELRQRNLVRRVHSQGARSTKHRQTLDEQLSLSERELALVSVLLLRGPQTIGELRLRTERHDVGFDDLDAVETCLAALASRSTPLVVQLARQPGHKEARWQHLLADADEQVEEDSTVAPLAARSDQQVADPVAVSTTPAPSRDAGELEGRVKTLEAEVATLRDQLTALAAQLGETLE